MFNTNYKNSKHIYIKLHFIVVILGFSAIFGKLINLEATSLVFFRTFIAAVCLIIFVILTRSFTLFQKDALIRGFGVGVLLAAHWITFFHAIKISNVSVTLGCLGSSTLFAAILEPFTDRKKIRVADILAGVAIIAGIYTIFRFEFRYVEGIIFSVISALLAAIFSIFNKHLSYRYDYRALAMGEIFSACIITLIILIVTGINPVQETTKLSQSDILYLILLGSIGTAYAYTATISVINRLNAYAVILAINLEPVYGILLARFIFGQSEIMTGGFYLGAGIILITVLLHTLYAEKLTIRGKK